MHRDSDQAPTRPEVSVVICTFTEQRWERLVCAVESVQQQSVPPDEIIVVVDHNPPLYEVIRSRFPEVIVGENHEKAGLSEARNSGVALARGAIIAFIDDDAVAAPDWLEHLLAAYQDEQVMGVGGAIHSVWASGRPAWFPREFDWVLGCTYVGSPEESAPVQRLIGCNMSFRREVFDRIGRFRSEIGRVGNRPFAGEETEFSIRACQHSPDRVILFVPQARVDHHVPNTRARWSYFLSRCYAEGLSKALLSRFVGYGDGLKMEWSYVLKTLPRGILRGVLDTIRQGNLDGVARALAIVAGLFATVAGFGRCTISIHLANLFRSRSHARARARASIGQRKSRHTSPRQAEPSPNTEESVTG
ncbi:MAG: glycosyltransferase family 2 protein [Chloroflexaceae bacterium]|nr:glycosyltransferase family 2 protein [Chloroflexaceae bacterium]